MHQVNIHEAKTNLSSLILEVEKERRPIRICRNGKPAVQLAPLPKKAKKKKKDLFKPDPELKATFKGDITKPLGKEVWGDLII